MRTRIAVVFGLFVAGWLWLDARAQTNAPLVRGAHRFEKIADDLYYSTSSGTMNVGANSPILISGSEALIVDSSITPASARAMVEDLKAITDKPIRDVVDSHYHYDHAFGNQIFGTEVRVIGHDNTAKRMRTNVMEQYTYLTSVEPVPARLQALRQRIATEQNAEQKAALERQVAVQAAYLEQVKEIKVTPPNVTFDKTMTLYRNGREIRLLYLGRGHTDTDVVVFLPRERIVMTGDLMESIVSYMGDSYPDEWIGTLDRLLALDFDRVMPGHGQVFSGKEKIRVFQRYLRDFIDQTMAFKRQGLTADQAAAKVDMTKYSTEFPAIRGIGVDVAGTRRIYKLADSPEPAAN